MKLRLYNALVLPEPGAGKPFHGEVRTLDDKISYVGAEIPSDGGFDREIDLHGALVIPGLKNAHTHSAMTFLRSFADDLPLQSWLSEQVFPREARLTPDSVYAFTRLAILEYLSNGITASFDMYFYRDAYAQANIDMGFRTVLCGALMAGDSPDVAARDFEHFNRLHPLIGYRIGAHGEYTASEELLRGLSELTHAYKTPFWSHNSETKSEMQTCYERHGMTPTQYFDSLGLFDYGGGGFHCVHATGRDIAIFKNRGLTAVTCPCSNAKLASGVAPLDEMTAAGVNLAVGTDGPASNNALDLIRELYFACVLQKLRLEDAAACPAGDLLRAATVGGARAMGLSDCDILAPGKQADIAVISQDAPNMRPVHDPVCNLVYAGSGRNVSLTMIAGRILYENGAFAFSDTEKIYADAERYTKEIIENGD